MDAELVLQFLACLGIAIGVIVAVLQIPLDDDDEHRPRRHRRR